MMFGDFRGRGRGGRGRGFMGPMRGGMPPRFRGKPFGEDSFMEPPFGRRYYGVILVLGSGEHHLMDRLRSARNLEKNFFLQLAACPDD